MVINVTKSSMPPFEEYVDEIKELWDSRWLTNSGIKHQQFESALQSYLAVPNVNLFSNGHQALEQVIQAFNLTGEVITTPFTFASTTHAIVRNGLKPIFCDVDPVHYTIDVLKIEELITEDTSAIIPVHVYGNVCDMEGIQQIADKYNLKVIYDAAHTFGITVDGHGIGKYGDASMFSFHATKVFHSIEGGAVTYSDQNLTKTLNSIKNFGISNEDDITHIGTNAKMNEFQAVMGLCNLRYIDREIEKRAVVYNRYMWHLSDIKGIQVRKEQKNVSNNYAYFPIVLNKYKYTRNELIKKLKENGIYVRKYFYPLTNNFSCYEQLLSHYHTPIAKNISENVITLPLYADLSLNDVDRICNLILE